MDIDYEKLAKSLLSTVSLKDVPSSTPSATMGHGMGGLFSSPGLSKPLFSAMVLPKLGLQAQLPVKAANETNPLYGIITGVTASSGDEPTGVCDDPPVTGVMKLCTHSFVFGRFSRMTKVYDVDRAGRVTNRGEFTDFDIYGNPFAGAGDNPQTPGIIGFDAAKAAQNEIAKALFELGVTWSRDFARILYTGTPTNNTAGGGYREFWGLETLVNTGYQDTETGVACPAADSIVYDYNDVQIEDDAEGFIRLITSTMRNLKWLASRAGLDPVSWKIVMPFSLFYAITESYPCTYLSYRCQTLNSAELSLNSADVERMRDEMRGNLYEYTGQYLLIDGQKVPVVLDDAIPETEVAPGVFSAGVFILPMTVLGRMPVTYMEYFSYDSPNGAMAMANLFAPDGSFYTTDSGRFMWHKKPPNNFCVQVLAKTEPRLMLLTPYLAARIDNVGYAPLAHERSPFTDSGYFVNGGKTAGDTTIPSYYSPVPENN